MNKYCFIIHPDSADLEIERTIKAKTSKMAWDQINKMFPDCPTILISINDVPYYEKTSVGWIYLDPKDCLFLDLFLDPN